MARFDITENTLKHAVYDLPVDSENGESIGKNFLLLLLNEQGIHGLLKFMIKADRLLDHHAPLRLSDLDSQELAILKVVSANPMPVPEDLESRREFLWKSIGRVGLGVAGAGAIVDGVRRGVKEVEEQPQNPRFPGKPPVRGIAAISEVVVGGYVIHQISNDQLQDRLTLVSDVVADLIATIDRGPRGRGR